MKSKYCYYCTEHEYCDNPEMLKPYKCKSFQGNLNYTLKIRIIRFFYWLFTKEREKR